MCVGHDPVYDVGVAKGDGMRAVGHDPVCGVGATEGGGMRAVSHDPSLLRWTMVRSVPGSAVSFLVLTDTSEFGVFAALCQIVNGQTMCVRFSSRAFSFARRCYSAMGRELLAIMFALETFRRYLLGTRFRLVTDHRACFVYSRHWLWAVADGEFGCGEYIRYCAQLLMD